MNDGRERRPLRSALHEAAHVTVAAALGLAPEGVRLFERQGGGEAVVPFVGTGAQHVQISLAGVVAEALGGFPLTEIERLTWDLRLAGDLSRLMGRSVQEFVEPTAALLLRHWGLVEDIADLLLLQRELSARDLLGLVIANQAGGSTRERGAS